MTAPQGAAVAGINPVTNRLYHEVIPENLGLEGEPTATTPDEGDSSARIATTEWVNARKNTIANARSGDRIEWPCPGGIQPLRAEVTDRDDIHIDWLMIAKPSFAPGYAIPGDGWRKEAW